MAELKSDVFYLLYWFIYRVSESDTFCGLVLILKCASVIKYAIVICLECLLWLHKIGIVTTCTSDRNFYLGYFRLEFLLRVLQIEIFPRGTSNWKFYFGHVVHHLVWVTSCS